MRKSAFLPTWMVVFVLFINLPVSTMSQQGNDEWLDPYDMLNYDASSKTMRKPAEPTAYDPPREEVDNRPDKSTACHQEVLELQKQIKEHKKTIIHSSKPLTCNPVFKRFLSRLLNEIRKLGVPNESTDVFYDASIRLSKQAMTEIESLVEDEDKWRTGALDNAISQILVDLKPHDYEAWKWRFEDTFGVELETLLKIGLFVLIITAIICTELWSTVSWFVQFKRMFAICFFVSIAWNWFYLYKIAFAEHQNNLMKMDKVNEKCTGMREINWSDSLKEWFRSTWTLQDDPCKKYYEVLMVNPILLVPPTKAISVTITTFITEPLKHFGQGISDFLRALLKDLPVTLQIPVLITIVLSILVFMYGSVQAAFQHGIMAPLRRPRRDPPPPVIEQPQYPHQPQPRLLQRAEDHGIRDEPAVPIQNVPLDQAEVARAHRNVVHPRRPNRVSERPGGVAVETLRTVNMHCSEDEMDSQRVKSDREEVEGHSDVTEVQQDERGLEMGASGDSVANRVKTQSKPQTTKPASQKPQSRPLKAAENVSRDKPSGGDMAVRPKSEGGKPQTLDVWAAGSPDKECEIETLGVPVQETQAAEAE